LAILYTDPIFHGAHLGEAILLFKYLHAIDAVCLARAAGVYCVREMMPLINDGSFAQLYPAPGQACYDSLVGAGSTCPACGAKIEELLTAHGCCAIVLFKLYDLNNYLTGDEGTLTSDNRDDDLIPSNRMRLAFNTKCGATATRIQRYCAAVAVKVAITIRNIRWAYYALHADAFHRLVIADIAQFLGMVEGDINIPADGLQFQGQSSANKPWYSQFTPSSWSTLADADTGVSLTVEIMPENSAAGTDINDFVSSSLNDGAVPFTNVGSDIRFLADPTVEVTASDSSAATAAASLFLVTLLVLFQL
jgi:hypothetical protein